MKSPTKILTAIALAIPGGMAGFFLGLLAINFFPDQCVTTGISTICENPVHLFGWDGYEATGMIGLTLGAVLAPGLFLYKTR